MTNARTVHVSREHWSRDLNPGLSPAAVARPGDEIIVQTFCCAKGSVTRSISTSAERFYEDLGYTPGMPVTGPTAIRGAQVDDGLRAKVLDIQHVNSIMTCRTEVSKSVLSQLGIDLPTHWQDCQADGGQ